MTAGKVVDYTAEPGYFKVDNSSMPSLFGGQFGDSLKETFSRIKYGGTPSSSQKVFFINLQEIKGIKFGTRTPINYFDCFYNSELFLRAHGTYSIKVTEPLKFYAEAIPRNAESVDINDINEQYLNEFLEALQAAINQMSADGTRISFVTSKARELSKYMANVLDEEWNQNRGMQVQSVGIGSLSYDEESQKLINMRNQGAMLSDPSVREGYVQGAIARGVEAAGSNTAGAGAAFMGVGLGMNAAATWRARSPPPTSSRCSISRLSSSRPNSSRLSRAAGNAPARHQRRQYGLLPRLWQQEARSPARRGRLDVLLRRDQRREHGLLPQLRQQKARRSGRQVRFLPQLRRKACGRRKILRGMRHKARLSLSAKGMASRRPLFRFPQ